MTDKEKQINLQVIDIRASLHNIMKDIESKELYNKLVDIDNQIYKIREIVKSEESGEEPPIKEIKPIEFEEFKEDSILGKIKAEIKGWYWQADKQALAEDPCVVDAMIDLFIRTINKYEKGNENKE